MAIVATFLSPSVVGFDFAAQSLRDVALRLLASVRDRDALLVMLTELLTQVEVRGATPDWQESIVKAMELPSQVEARIRAELSDQTFLFHTECIRWLIGEVAAAYPWPWGIPARGWGGEQIESMFFPSLKNGRPPSRAEIYRAVFVAHEAFARRDRQDDEPFSDYLLAIEAAGAFRFLKAEPEEVLARALEMWCIEDSHPVLPRHVRPSALRKTFERETGVGLTRFLSWAQVVWLRMRALYGEQKDIADKVAVLLRRFTDAEHSRFAALIRSELSASPGQLQDRIRQELRTRGESEGYHRWGNVPMSSPESLRNLPVLDTAGDLIPIGLAASADSLADLVIRVLERTVTDAQGRIGYLFEAYVHDLTEELRPRHWLSHEKRILDVVGRDARVPDLLIGYDGRLLAVEITANRPNERVGRGELGSIMKRIQIYRQKNGEARSIESDAREIASQLFGWSEIRSFNTLVVTAESIPTTPRLEAAMQRTGAKDSRFVCSIDEYETLVGLARRGWEAPSLIASWITRRETIPLGAHLAESAKITHVDHWLLKRSTRRLFECLARDAA